VNIGLAADTVEDGQVQAQTCGVGRDSRKSVDVLKVAEILNGI
jgi:hypothetical protein